MRLGAAGFCFGCTENVCRQRIRGRKVPVFDPFAVLRSLILNVYGIVVIGVGLPLRPRTLGKLLDNHFRWR